MLVLVLCFSTIPMLILDVFFSLVLSDGISLVLGSIRTVTLLVVRLTLLSRHPRREPTGCNHSSSTLDCTIHNGRSSSARAGTLECSKKAAGNHVSNTGLHSSGRGAYRGVSWPTI